MLNPRCGPQDLPGLQVVVALAVLKVFSSPTDSTILWFYNLGLPKGVLCYVLVSHPIASSTSPSLGAVAQGMCCSCCERGVWALSPFPAQHQDPSAPLHQQQQHIRRLHLQQRGAAR